MKTPLGIAPQGLFTICRIFGLEWFIWCPFSGRYKT